MLYYETEFGTPVEIPENMWVPSTWKLITKKEFDDRTAIIGWQAPKKRKKRA